MDCCSYFIKDTALFGRYPSQEDIKMFEDLGVIYYIDLTENEEDKIVPYKTERSVIRYPIKDRSVPKDWKSFSILIIKISEIIKGLKSGEKIYIHCKGGHGRSGILVACLFCYILGKTPTEALEMTKKCHSERKVMRDKWRRIGSPQSKKQKEFVYKFFGDLRYTNEKLGMFPSVFSNFFPCTIAIPGVGCFSNAHLAYFYYRDPDNKEYVEGLLKGKVDLNIANNENFKKWKKNRVNYMHKVLKYKFSQNVYLQSCLLRTGFRTLIKRDTNIFWGKNDQGEGENVHGRILMELRDKLLYK